MHKTKAPVRVIAMLLAVVMLAAMPPLASEAAQSQEAFLDFFINVMIPLIQQMQKLMLQFEGGSPAVLPKIGISAGHGGNTGAYAGGVFEDVKNLAMAQAVNSEFTARGYTTKMNRTDNSKCDKDTKLALYKAWGPDILLEFHYNSTAKGDGSASGLEVWYKDGNARGKKLAELLADRLSAAAGLRNRGAKSDKSVGGFYVCQSFPVAVLIECAFLDNPDDVKKLDSAAARQKFARAAADAVEEFLAMQ